MKVGIINKSDVFEVVYVEMSCTGKVTNEELLSTKHKGHELLITFEIWNYHQELKRKAPEFSSRRKNIWLVRCREKTSVVGKNL